MGCKPEREKRIDLTEQVGEHVVARKSRSHAPSRGQNSPATVEGDVIEVGFLAAADDDPARRPEPHPRAVIAGDGRGRLTAERRAYYLGTLVAGKRQGFGLLRWMDRTEYCGSWHADTPDGSGVETYEDGSWYAGGFKADKRHGMGGIWAADGLIYMGQWQNGVRHGSGVISHADSVKIDLKGKGQTEEVPPQSIRFTLSVAIFLCSRLVPSSHPNVVM